MLEAGGLEGDVNGGVSDGALVGFKAGLAETLDGFGDVTGGGEACKGDWG